METHWLSTDAFLCDDQFAALEFLPPASHPEGPNHQHQHQHQPQAPAARSFAQDTAHAPFFLPIASVPAGTPYEHSTARAGGADEPAPELTHTPFPGELDRPVKYEPQQLVITPPSSPVRDDHEVSHVQVVRDPPSSPAATEKPLPGPEGLSKHESRVLRNRASARRSAQRKKQYVDEMEARIRFLEQSNGELEQSLELRKALAEQLAHILKNAAET